MIVEGWMYQMELLDGRVELFVKDVNGKNFVFRDEFNPDLILIPKDGRVNALKEVISKHPNVVDVRVEDKFLTLFDEKKTKVLKVYVDSPRSYEKFLRDIKNVPDLKETAETKVPFFLKYLMDKKLRFFKKVEIDDSRKTLRCKLLQESRDEDVELNCLALDVKLDGGRIERIVVLSKNIYRVFESRDEDKLIEKFLEEIRGLGYEVLITYDGNNFLRLLNKKLLSNFRHGSPLKIVENRCGVRIPGKIHVDIREDMSRDFPIDNLPSPDFKDIVEHFFGKSNVSEKERIQYIYVLGLKRLIGIIELSKMCNSKPDLVPKMTAGMLNTFIHYETAYNEKVVIPDQKKIMEDVKTLRELMELDKGGMIIYPEPGVYFNVGKVDFSSMYPNIIVKWNISPETVNCSCCGGICKKRVGLVPKGLRRVLERRLELKRKMRESNGIEREVYDIKQRALKGLLVCSFGYLGYSAFIFSRVECKELINKISRKIMLKTKEIAEKHKLRVISGYVDCIFVMGQLSQIKKFCEEVSSEFDIDLELDKYFKVIVFCSSKQSKFECVVNRYFGITPDEELECRGIMLRRRDTPRVIKRVQEKVIFKVLRDVKSLDELRSRARSLDVDRLIERELNSKNVDDFVVRKFLSKLPWEYEKNVEHVRAMKLMNSNEIVNEIKYCYVKNSLFDVLPVKMVKLSDVNKPKYEEKARESINELIDNILIDERFCNTNKIWNRVKSER